MSGKNIKVMDYLVHGGHQYEFFKNSPQFFCTSATGTAPLPQHLGRPKNKNVKFVNFGDIIFQKFDILMYRQGIKEKFYNEILKRNKGIRGIAVVQTHRPPKIPDWATHVVWNSKTVMDQFYKDFPKKIHHYIPHGFDPDEFNFLNLKRNDRVLTSASLFEQRDFEMGYSLWKDAADNLGNFDVIGHGNEKIKGSIGSFELKNLVKLYNTYSLYLNTTIRSAMPRSRAEALMCGTPIITTKNYDIDMYLKDNISCIFADSKDEIITSIKKLLSSPSMQKDLSEAGREAAINNFHISNYLLKWNNVFLEILK
jgi:glycosyltransferase involved in cell wall biosynthesis